MEYFDKKTEKICYIVWSGGCLMTFLTYAILNKMKIVWSQIIPTCFWYRLTGYYCPGCGGTRAVKALFHLHFLQSFLFHPLVLYICVVGSIFWIKNTWAFISHGKYKGLKLRPLYLYVALIIILLQWCVKNILLYTMNYQIPVFR